MLGVEMTLKTFKIFKMKSIKIKWVTNDHMNGAYQLAKFTTGLFCGDQSISLRDPQPWGTAPFHTQKEKINNSLMLTLGYRDSSQGYLPPETVFITAYYSLEDPHQGPL